MSERVKNVVSMTMTGVFCIAFALYCFSGIPLPGFMKGVDDGNVVAMGFFALIGGVAVVMGAIDEYKRK